jgi:hypothetical protein
MGNLLGKVPPKVPQFAQIDQDGNVWVAMSVNIGLGRISCWDK